MSVDTIRQKFRKFGRQLRSYASADTELSLSAFNLRTYVMEKKIGGVACYLQINRDLIFTEITGFAVAAIPNTMKKMLLELEFSMVAQ